MVNRLSKLTENFEIICYQNKINELTDLTNNFDYLPKMTTKANQTSNVISLSCFTLKMAWLLKSSLDL
jgi:hypothetical protein